MIQVVKLLGITATLSIDVDGLTLTNRDGVPSLEFQAKPLTLFQTISSTISGLTCVRAYRLAQHFYETGIDLHHLPLAALANQSPTRLLGCEPESLTQAEKRLLDNVDLSKFVSLIAAPMYSMTACLIHNHDYVEKIADNLQKKRAVMIDREDIEKLMSNESPTIRTVPYQAMRDFWTTDNAPRALN